MKIAPFGLERYLAKHEFTAPILMGSSDCESISIQELLDLTPDPEQSKHTLTQTWLGYTESLGAPLLRQEISKLYTQTQSPIGPQHVLVHAGAEEAIFNFMNVALNPGDHVIVHFPCYQSLEEIARSIGCEVTRWETQMESDWELDLDFLKKSIRSNTKVIVVNSPHNPTGYQMSTSKQAALVQIARRHGIILFSDEVYRFMEHGTASRLSGICELYENGVSLGVMSKSFGLAGLRIGWIATQNQSIFNQMAEYKDYTSICNSGPSEVLSVIALQNKDTILSRNKNLAQSNLKLLTEMMARNTQKLSWSPPLAGVIAFPRSLEKPFYDELLKQKGVLVLPGRYYDVSDQHFRVGFGRKNFSEALSRFENFLN